MTIAQVPAEREPETFAQSVLRGLTASPKTLDCRYFYDAEGSQLFEQICELPEYYPTRTEDAILRDHADAMVSGWDDAPALVELGSGSSTKTRRLIAAFLEEYGALHYVPIDVSPTILEDSARALADDFPSLRISGYAGDYRVAIAEIARKISRPKCVIFLGSSLGNYDEADAVALLSHLARAMTPADRLLLGTDLAKDRASLEAAYDDAQGVSAAFNRNVLARINRELGGAFDPDSFDHQALYREDLGRVEMRLVSRRDQVVRIDALDFDVPFADGESIHTESAHKYTPGSLRSLAERSGFVEDAAWTDAGGKFRVQRWRVDVG